MRSLLAWPRMLHTSRSLLTAAPTPKPDIQLISRLRKHVEGVSIQRVKEALMATNNDFDEAKSYLTRLMAADADKRERKGKSATSEGVIAIIERPGLGASMFELSCETDFVARTPLFQQLALRIAQTALFLHTPDPVPRFNTVNVEDVLSLPILQEPASSENQGTAPDSQRDVETVAEAIKQRSGHLGERIQLRRGVVVSTNQHAFVAAGVHGFGSMLMTTPPSSTISMKMGVGKMGALAVLGKRSELDVSDERFQVFAAQLAQHIIGMKPRDELTLLQQPFLFDQSKTVSDVVAAMSKEQQDQASPLLLRSIMRMECGQDEAEDEDAISSSEKTAAVA